MFGILSIFFWPVLLIGIYYIYRSRQSASDNSLNLDVDPEETLADALMLLMLAFLGVGLFNLTADFSLPVSWDAILLAVSLLGFIIVYKFKVRTPLIFGLVGIAIWWTIRASTWINVVDFKPSAIFSVLGLYITSIYLASFLFNIKMDERGFGYIFKSLGIVPIVFIFFGLSTKAGLQFLNEVLAGQSFFDSWQMTISLFTMIVLSIGLLGFMQSKSKLNSSELIFVLIPIVTFLLLPFLPEMMLFTADKYYLADLTSTGFLWAAIFNVATFALIVSILMSGYARTQKYLVNFGLMFMFLFIFVKYFDWFFSFLDKSLFFLGAGILLFGLGWFMERSRKAMIENIEDDEK